MKNLNKTYFKFSNLGESWILPVYKDSLMFSNPEECFQWDKNIHFVKEVNEQEYRDQFITRKNPIQLELNF